MEGVRKVGIILMLFAMILIGCGNGGGKSNSDTISKVPTETNSDSDATGNPNDQPNTGGDETGNPDDQTNTDSDGTGDTPGDGGSSSPDTELVTLFGSYEVVSFSVKGTPEPAVSSSLCTVFFDNEGNYEIIKKNKSILYPVGVNPPFPDSGAYSLNADGTAFAFSTLTGAVSPSGDLFIFTQVGKRDEQVIGFGVKNFANILAPENLSGVYQMAGLNYTPAPLLTSLFAAADFDGNGGMRISGRKSDNHGRNRTYEETGTYNLDTERNGYTFNLSETGRLAVAVTPPVDLFIYTNVGSIYPKELGEQEIGVGVRSGSSGFSNSSLSGDYERVDLIFSGSGWRASSLGTVSFDGSGNYTFSGVYSQSGGSSDGPNQEIWEAGTYQVGDNGIFSIRTDDAIELSGVLSRSGDLYIYSDVSNPGEQRLGIAIKR